MKKNKIQTRFIEELEKNPIISIVCEKVGIARNTFYRWIKEDGSFSKRADEAQRIGVDMVNDAAESNVLNGIKNRDSKYTMFWLTHRNAKYKHSHRAEDKDEQSVLEREKEKKAQEEAVKRISKWQSMWFKKKPNIK